MEFVKLESRDKLRIMTISRESVLNALRQTGPGGDITCRGASRK